MSETFTAFVDGAPLATATSTSDLVALIQAGVTKRIDPLALLAAIVQAASAATAVGSADLLALLQGGTIKSLDPALLQNVSFPTVVTTGTSYAVLPADTFIAVDKASDTSIQLPTAPASGRILGIADLGGNAESYPITVLPGAGATIDGESDFSLIFGWQAAAFEYVPTLSTWKVL